MSQRIEEAASQLIQLIEQFQKKQGAALAVLAGQVSEVFAAGGQLLVAGQGRLRPLGQLLVSHLVWRLGFDRPVLPALALGGDPVLAAAMQDDGSAEQLLLRHYRALGSQQHLVLLLSDGRPNRALQLLRDEALEHEQPVVLLTPDRQQDPLVCDGLGGCLSLGTADPARLLELALVAVNLLCEQIEAELFQV